MKTRNMRVKIISSIGDTPEDTKNKMEKAINEWLKDNDNKKIIRADMTSMNSQYLIYTIMYTVIKLKS